MMHQPKKKTACSVHIVSPFYDSIFGEDNRKNILNCYAYCGNINVATVAS